MSDYVFPLPTRILSQTGVFETVAPLNGVELKAWLTDMLEGMVSGRNKGTELARLLPWTWKSERLAAAVNA